ncbi:MAG: hypothetical protein NZ805_08730 [Armatimonadetes bacterium]|nr:hypothetical protein [Armatimonadota bacterium]MDW8028121.1 hypothetical protein [Armatimonadota bacterium]
MKLELGFELSDLTKALDGWIGMVQAFKLKLREDVATETFAWAIVQATFGCAILMFILTMVSVALLSASLWRVWKFFEGILPETLSQRQWHPTNEVSQSL